MAKLWGGRFNKNTDKLTGDFNASISFDQRLYEQDIKGSIAHAHMLAKQGILTEEEGELIVKTLGGSFRTLRTARSNLPKTMKIFI